MFPYMTAELTNYGQCLVYGYSYLGSAKQYAIDRVKSGCTDHVELYAYGPDGYTRFDVITKDNIPEF